eukprot:1371551-Amorphochlora_amoeboformis.AAC.1
MIDIDSSGTGKLIQNAFADFGHSGGIEFPEMLAAMASPEYEHITFMDAVKKFKEINKSEDGVVSTEEFVKYFLAEFGGVNDKSFEAHMLTIEKFMSRKPALEKLFEHLDKDKNGKLDEKEVQAMLQLPGEAKVTGEQAFRVLKSMDSNHNGKVEKSELVRAMFKQTKNLSEQMFAQLMKIMSSK